MLKRIFTLLLAAALALSLVIAVFAAEQEAEPLDQAAAETGVQVEVTPAAFYVDGDPIYDVPRTTSNRGVTYVPIAVFLRAVMPGCTIDRAEDGLLTLSGTTSSGEALTVTARCGDNYLTANGRCLYVADSVFSYRGFVMAPISLLASIFNGSAFWAGEECHARLGDTLIASGDAYYDAESLDLLSRLIYSESGNQPLAGKLAVGSVILNRLDDSRFPDTLYDVIYAKNQFCVVRNGTINLSPNDESVIAAKLTLEGVRTTTALYFNRSGLNSWAARNCTYVATIGSHDFYA